MGLPLVVASMGASGCESVEPMEAGDPGPGDAGIAPLTGVPIFDEAPLAIPDELQHKLAECPAFNATFRALTPGRQRAYVIYFSAAKQYKTRKSRIEAYTPRILDGKGLNDCVCGLSRKLPNCDGSHNSMK